MTASDRRCPTCGTRRDEWEMFWFGWVAAGFAGVVIFAVILVIMAVLP